MRGRDLAVRTIARAAAWGWFRSIETAGMERIPARGPLLVVASHEGGFVDPVLLAATLPRYPRFLAMASLWRTPARPFLWLAGAIPVHRRDDRDAASNERAFAASHAVLADDGTVGIFPEGRASDEVRLLPMKTGAARIALGARAVGAEGLRIVPVGLIYEHKGRARARAYVRVGAPIDLDAQVTSIASGRPVGETDRVAVDRLTATIRERLAAVALDFESAAQMGAFTTAATIALRPLDADPGWRPPFAAREDLATRIADGAPERQEEVRAAVDAYRDALEANAITDAAVAADPSRHRRVHVMGLATAALLAVPALVGAVVNAVPAGLTWLVGRREMAPVTRATVKFLVALACFPLAWVVWRYLPPVSGTELPWVAVAVAGPLCGLATAWFAARARRARRARVNLRRLASVGTSLVELRTRRDRVVEAVAGVTADDRFGQAGVPAGSLGDRP